MKYITFSYKPVMWFDVAAFKFRLVSTRKASKLGCGFGGFFNLETMLGLRLWWVTGIQYF